VLRRSSIIRGRLNDVVLDQEDKPVRRKKAGGDEKKRT